jgi:two-component system LytT family sensor kinase
MKLLRPKKVYIYGFVISMPFIVFALNHIIYDERAGREWQIWIFSTLLLYFIGFFSWYAHVQYEYFIQRKFPGLSQTPKRIFYKLLTNLFVMTPSVILIFLVYDWFHILGYSLKTEDLKWGYIVGLCINFLFVTLWEVLYLLSKYKESLSERELLEKMNMEQEFENLKNQINPHFLFNCFNTLSSLIQEDKREAEKFLDELSKVYRYLLKSNEDGISTVEKELKFIQSYYRLLKTRYGSGLQLTTDVDKRYYSYLLPSLCLQLLVENAVKHNIVSRLQPLVIEIFTAAGNKLVVNNNLQRKQISKISTRIGLNNIRSKYKLIRQEGFQVIEGETNFMVVLPLVWNDAKEGVDSQHNQYK